MKFLHLPVTLLGLGFMIAAPHSALAAEDLPWGQSQPPRVITPGNGSVVVSPQANNGGNQGGPTYGGTTYGGTNGTYQDRPYERKGAGTYYQPAPRYSAPGGQAPHGGNGQYNGGNSRYNGGKGQYNGQYGGDGRHGHPNGPYGGRQQRPGPYAEQSQRGYSSEDIVDAGRNFFGSVSGGLASVIEYAFQKQGRPNGYILGEEAGGAFIAGLRYGEGTLYTRDAGQHRIFWQGPSLGYDFGAEGSKTMILVYNLNYPEQIYRRYSGVDGSAFLVGGVGISFQKRGDVVLAPIRSGVGVRLGANVGYLKYSRRPTWNPF